MAKQKAHKHASGIVLDRGIAFAIGWDAGNRHMSKHTLKPWDDEAYNVAAEKTNRLLMGIPFDQGGLMGIPEDQLIAAGLISASHK